MLTEYHLIRVPINQRYGYISRSKSRICLFHFVDGVTATGNPHHTMKLSYSNFEKREKTILGKKKEHQELFLLLMTICLLAKSDKNLSVQNQNKGIPGTAANYVDQLKMVVFDKNIL